MLKHIFVDHVPDQIEEGVLYISIPFETVIHKCCCGCGNEVVTPLSPAAWSMTFDGEVISLNPSIGNWNFECKSHYWIKKNKVHWSSQFSDEQMVRVKQKDFIANQSHYDKKVEQMPLIESKKWYDWLLNLFK